MEFPMGYLIEFPTAPKQNGQLGLASKHTKERKTAHVSPYLHRKKKRRNYSHNSYFKHTLLSIVYATE